MFIIQLFLYFSNNTNEVYMKSEEFAIMEAKIDSLKKSKQRDLTEKVYLFNPNYLSDYRAYQLGMCLEEIDKLFAYRQQGNFINSVQEFQTVTGVSDSLLQIIAPSFKFPKWAHKRPITKTSTLRVNLAPKVKDLNHVTFQDLLLIEGVNEKLARRIISYRELILGYSVDEQLYEVFYLEKNVANNILRYYKVIETHLIDKIDINVATFKQLLALPYIDYELTKKILRYRDENVFFTELEELKKIDSFPLDNFHRIALYLSAE